MLNHVPAMADGEFRIWHERMFDKPFRSHSHCPDCHGEDFTVEGKNQVCSRCNLVSPRPVMVACTPINCGSS